MSKNKINNNASFNKTYTIKVKNCIISNNTNLKVYQMLTNFIFKMIKDIKYIENSKQNLFNIKNFNPYILFKNVFNKNVDKIYYQDIEKYMKHNCIYDKDYKKSINLLISLFNNNTRSYLNYQEFEKIITPKINIKFDFKNLETKLHNYDMKSIRISSNTLLSDILIRYLNLLNDINSIKIEIYLENINYFKLFKKLDQNKDTFIDIQDIQKFFLKAISNLLNIEKTKLKDISNLNLTDNIISIKNLNLIINFFDAHNDNKISFKEFLQMILPNKETCIIKNSIFKKLYKEYEKYEYTITNKKYHEIFKENNNNSINIIRQLHKEKIENLNFDYNKYKNNL